MYPFIKRRCATTLIAAVTLTFEQIYLSNKIKAHMAASVVVKKTTCFCWSKSHHQVVIIVLVSLLLLLMVLLLLLLLSLMFASCTNNRKLRLIVEIDLSLLSNHILERWR